MQIAVELDHPAYDCLYLALALANGSDFVTADDRFLRMVQRAWHVRFSRFVISLLDAAAKL
jgi:predicted nucleic acid-binding protein